MEITGGKDIIVKVLRRIDAYILRYQEERNTEAEYRNIELRRQQIDILRDEYGADWEAEIGYYVA